MVRVNAIAKTELSLLLFDSETSNVDCMMYELDLCANVFGNGCTETQNTRHECIQNSQNCIRTYQKYFLDIFYAEAGWVYFKQRRQQHQFATFFEIANGLIPLFLMGSLPSSVGHNLRNSANLIECHFTDSQVIVTVVHFYYLPYSGLPNHIEEFLISTQLK